MLFFSIFKGWVAGFVWIFFDRVPTPKTWGFVALVMQATLIFKSSSGWKICDFGTVVGFIEASTMKIAVFYYFYPDLWGNDPIWRAYFSNGLVQPSNGKDGTFQLP